MKGFIKNNIKVFVAVIISGIIFGGIGVYAASQYLAREIHFTPLNENFTKENGEAIDNVEDALNELYNISNFDFTNNDTKVAYYMGNRTNGKTVSLSLEKGKYFVFVVNSHSWANSEKFNNKGDANYLILNVTNGSCNFIKGYYVSPTATNLTATNKYVSQYTYSQIYECELTEDDTVSFTTADGNYDDCSQGVILESLKIK